MSSSIASKIQKLKPLISQQTPKLNQKVSQPLLGPKQMLLRDFIHDRLYGEPGGMIFCKSIERLFHKRRSLSRETQGANKILKIAWVLRLQIRNGAFISRQLMGHSLRVIQAILWLHCSQLYAYLQIHLIFHQSQQYLLCKMLNQMEENNQKKLRIVEIGPGTGTMADSILDFFKNYNLDLYRNCEYVFIEISPQLAETCEKFMKEKHRQLYDHNKIKIFNGSILEFQKSIPRGEMCFVIALEVLDNMPHDRFYFDSKTEKLVEQAIIAVDKDDQGNEVLTEEKKKIDEVNDEFSRLFVDLFHSMPSKDHISANQILKTEGFFKRLQDALRTAKYQDKLTQNIFGPTQALKMIQHINQYIPDHCLIMADFDSFLMPSNSIKGISAPLVTNKLKDPTQWQTYDTYLVPRGEADICFPVDFFFLKHAYQKLTGLTADVYKTQDFVEQFSLASWCQTVLKRNFLIILMIKIIKIMALISILNNITVNGFNPLKEEYFNTSFLVTDRTKK